MRTSERERFEVLHRLTQAGITLSDAEQLRRIALTLHSWNERECGTDHGCIERDEATGKPYWYRSNHSFIDPHDPRARYRIPDREKGAQKRLHEIMKRYTRRFLAYEQGDPRGASLYLVRRKDIPKGASIDGYYSRGIAIY